MTAACIDWNDGGAYLAMAGESGWVRYWNVTHYTTPKLARLLHGLDCVLWSGDPPEGQRADLDRFGISLTAAPTAGPLVAGRLVSAFNPPAPQYERALGGLLQHAIRSRKVLREEIKDVARRARAERRSRETRRKRRP